MRTTNVGDRSMHEPVAPNGLAEAARTPGLSGSREFALASRWLRCWSLPGDPDSPITRIPATIAATTPSVAVDKRQANREHRGAAHHRNVRADGISRGRCRSRRRLGLARSVGNCALPGIGWPMGWAPRLRSFRPDFAKRADRSRRQCFRHLRPDRSVASCRSSMALGGGRRTGQMSALPRWHRGRPAEAVREFRARKWRRRRARRILCSPALALSLAWVPFAAKQNYIGVGPGAIVHCPQQLDVYARIAL